MIDERIFVCENDDLIFPVKNNSMIEVNLSKMVSKWFHFYTFSNEHQLPAYKQTDIPNLNPARTYIVEILLNNKDYLEGLHINLSEYSASNLILNHHVSGSFLERGDHRFNYLFKPSLFSEKFKLTFKVKSLIPNNKLLIKNIVIYSCIN
jgi:hypothetical protein